MTEHDYAGASAEMFHDAYASFERPLPDYTPEDEWIDRPGPVAVSGRPGTCSCGRNRATFRASCDYCRDLALDDLGYGRDTLADSEEPDAF